MRTISRTGAFSIGLAAFLFAFASEGIARAAVPEIDASTAGSGLALLAVGVLLVIERRRNRR
jgi:hypothetical protein